MDSGGLGVRGCGFGWERRCTGAGGAGSGWRTRPVRSSRAASKAAASRARTLASASARASLTSPGALCSAAASIASRSSSITRSSATTGPLSGGGALLIVLALDDLLAVGLHLLLLPLRPSARNDLLTAMLLDDDLLSLTRCRKAGGLLQALEPGAQVLVLLLELLGARGQRRVGLPPVDPHLLRPLDRSDQQAQLDGQ